MTSSSSNTDRGWLWHPAIRCTVRAAMFVALAYAFLALCGILLVVLMP